MSYIHLCFLWHKLSGGIFLDQGKWISNFNKYAWSLSIGVVILHIFVFSAWVTGTTVLFNVFQSHFHCFPPYWWVWASFHKLVGYLSLYFSDLPIQILCFFSFSCQFTRHLLYALQIICDVSVTFCCTIFRFCIVRFVLFSFSFIWLKSLPATGFVFFLDFC